jgi:GH24 family phage-related lysozyme (muramidase)
MADPEILKEFLMALGFKVDEPSLRKMQATINKVTGVIETMGAVTSAVAVMIDENVLQMAKSFDTLYYSSQRIGTSVKNIQTLQFAAQMVGVSATTATSALESMARAMRLNPGLSGLLNNLGVQTKGRDPADMQLDLLHRLKGMQPYIAAQFGQQFGIDPDTLNLLLKNLDRFDAARKERLKMFQDAGLNPDQLATQSADFEHNMLRFDTQFEIFQALIGQRFLPAVDWLLEGLNKILGLIDKHTGGKQSVAGSIGIAGAGLGGAYLGTLGAKGILHWIGKQLGLRVATKTPLVVPEAEAEGLGVGAAGEGAGAAAASEVIIPIVLAVLAGLGLGWLINKLTPEGWGESTSMSDAVSGWTRSAGRGVASAGKWLANQTVDAFTKASEGLRLKAYPDAGKWLANQTVDAFTKASEGLRLKAYPDAGKWAIGFGHQILPGENFSGGITKEKADQLYTQDMGKAAAMVYKLTAGMGLKPNQMGALDDFQFNTGTLGNSRILKLLRAGKFEEAAHAFENSYTTSKGVFSQDLFNRRLGEEAMFRGGANVTLNTAVTVHGTNDGEGTGRAVIRGQKDVAASLVRHAVGVPQ